MKVEKKTIAEKVEQIVNEDKSSKILNEYLDLSELENLEGGERSQEDVEVGCTAVFSGGCSK